MECRRRHYQLGVPERTGEIIEHVMQELITDERVILNREIQRNTIAYQRHKIGRKPNTSSHIHKQTYTHITLQWLLTIFWLCSSGWRSPFSCSSAAGRMIWEAKECFSSFKRLIWQEIRAVFNRIKKNYYSYNRGITVKRKKLSSPSRFQPNLPVGGGSFMHHARNTAEVFLYTLQTQGNKTKKVN